MFQRSYLIGIERARMTEIRRHLGNDCQIKRFTGRCLNSTEFTGLALCNLHLHKKSIAGLNGPLESQRSGKLGK